MTSSELILGAEIVVGLVFAAAFAISVTGRRGMNGWETKNLNRAALLSGVGAAFVCIVLLVQMGAPHAP